MSPETLRKKTSKPDFSLEKDLKVNYVAGIDEAGRGPWAGPVVSAAVILTPGFFKTDLCSSIDDSKKIKPEKRETIVEKLIKLSQENPPLLYIGIGEASAQEIDQINILEATFLAAERALENLPQKPQAILMDGSLSFPYNLPVHPIVQGDQKSLSIAAASLVAKVTRDQIMDKFAKQYPTFGWEKNKGYGTKQHQNAIAEYGVTPHHRLSFKPLQKFKR